MITYSTQKSLSACWLYAYVIGVIVLKKKEKKHGCCTLPLFSCSSLPCPSLWVWALGTKGLAGTPLLPQENQNMEGLAPDRPHRLNEHG